jgi:hypothetical protein
MAADAVAISDAADAHLLLPWSTTGAPTPPAPMAADWRDAGSTD